MLNNYSTLTDTRQAEVPAYKLDNALARDSFVDAINRWDNRVGMKKLEKGGGYVGMAKYPWNLAKANLAKHWHDQDVMVVIFHNVKQAVKELEEKKKENDLTMRDGLELDRGRRWLKDYRRRKDNEGRKKRRSKSS